MKSSGLPVDSERRIDVNYIGSFVRGDFRIDLIVEDTIVIELKTVDLVHPVYLAQVITYLKLGGFPTGLIMNFNVNLMKHGIRRGEHPDRYVKKPRRASVVE